MRDVNLPVLLAAGLQPVDYAIVLVYTVCMLCIGWVLSRKQVSLEDFFVGGHSMPWMATGLSMIATLMSTLSYLGSPGEMIKHGVAQFAGILALPFVFIVVWTLWVPFFMRLNLTSAYEYLEMRFGPKARMLGVVLYLYLRFLWMGAIIYSAALALGAHHSGYSACRHRVSDRWSNQFQRQFLVLRCSDFDRSCEHLLHGYGRHLRSHLDGRHSDDCAATWCGRDIDRGRSGNRNRTNRLVDRSDEYQPFDSSPGQLEPVRTKHDRLGIVRDILLACLYTRIRSGGITAIFFEPERQVSP